MNNKKTSEGSLPEELEDTDTVIRIGERTFSSVDELRDAYLKESSHRQALETVVGRQGKELGDFRGGRESANGAGEDEDFGIPKERFEKFDSEFVADPNKAMADFARDVIRATEKRVESKILNQVANQNTIESFWSDYFDKFPTHEAIEGYVRMEGNRMAESGMLNGRSRSDQMDEIATRINSVGSKVFGGGKTRDVPDRKIVTGTGGAGSGKSNGKVPEPASKPVSFMDEVRSSIYRKDPIGG